MPPRVTLAVLAMPAWDLASVYALVVAGFLSYLGVSGIWTENMATEKPADGGGGIPRTQSGGFVPLLSDL